MKLKLKLVKAENQKLSEKDIEILDSIVGIGVRKAKISTIKKNIKYDSRGGMSIDKIINIKIVFQKRDGGILILIGNIGIDYRMPRGGDFYCYKVLQDVIEFETIKGIGTEVSFINTLEDEPTDVQEMKEILKKISENPDFEYNFKQFSEFMDIFKFYKNLSLELNNNKSFKIISKSKTPYYFASHDVEINKTAFFEELKDKNNVFLGYKFSETEFNKLDDDTKSKVKKIIDINIDADKKEIKMLEKNLANNIFLSNYKSPNEKNIEYLKLFTVINIQKNENRIKISGELKSEEDYLKNFDFLNIYDAGQKIKMDSIDESLKLISKGSTGANIELIEYLIGDGEMPNLDIDVSDKNINAYISGLNESQKAAFKKAIDGSPITLIKGPPGTGKTHVINAIVQFITKELNEKVIISSQTHVAIDNVLDKLMENHDPIIPNRITKRKNRYSGEEIDKTLFNTWASKFEKHNYRATDLDIAKNIFSDIKNFSGKKEFCYSENMTSDGFKVIGATTTTAALTGHKGIQLLKDFKWLIIDEVSKCPITEVFRYIPYIEKIILVGDDYQLAPLLEFSKEDIEGLPSYNEDLFQQLKKVYEQSVFAKVLNKAIATDRLVLLNENYRSVPNILSTYNVFYNRELKGVRKENRLNKMFADKTAIDFNNNDVFFIEVKGGQEMQEGTSRLNIEEIKATAYVLKDLLKSTNNPEKITVSAIFPYDAQINYFQKHNLELINEAKKKFKSFEIDTVDAFQGKESDIVLVNTVVTDQSKMNFLNEFRRINVSLSRAKEKLFLFGNSITLNKIEMKTTNGEKRKFLKEIIEFIKSKGCLIEYKGGKINAIQSKIENGII